MSSTETGTGTQTLAGVEISEFGAEDGDTVREVVDLVNAVQTADSPWVHPTTVHALTAMIRHGWEGEPPRVLVARAGGVTVGTAEYWASEWDNTDLAWLWLAVHPEHRRRGVGSALLGELLALAARDDRPKVGIEGWDGPATYGFAAAHGFEKKSQAINRRQLLAEVDREAVARLREEAAAAATTYELVAVAGRTPEELLGPVATMTAAINDAPLDDLDMDDLEFSPARIRSYEDATRARGDRLYRLMARHRATGELAGHTVVVVDGERPTLAEQHDTSVLRAHRGHRLGLLLKAAMVLLLGEREPQLVSVDTWNAESNDHMIAVNEQLGYRVMGRGIQFQRVL